MRLETRAKERNRNGKVVGKRYCFDQRKLAPRRPADYPTAMLGRSDTVILQINSSVHRSINATVASPLLHFVDQTAKTVPADRVKRTSGASGK